MVERDRNMAGAARAGQTSGGSRDEQATPMKEQVQHTAADVKEQVQHTAADLKEQVATQATGTMANQKDAASDNLNTVAHAFRQTSEHLRDSDQAGIAGYVDRAAGQVEHVAGYLSKRDLREIAQDAEQFARREPALFLGGALALGLFAARFLKSSGQAAQGGGQGYRGDRQSQADRSGQRSAPQVTPPPPLPTHTAPTASAAATRPAAMPSSTGSAASGFGTNPGRPTPPTTTGRAPQATNAHPDVIVGGPPHEPGRGGR